MLQCLIITMSYCSKAYSVKMDLKVSIATIDIWLNSVNTHDYNSSLSSSEIHFSWNLIEFTLNKGIWENSLELCCHHWTFLCPRAFHFPQRYSWLLWPKTTSIYLRPILSQVNYNLHPTCPMWQGQLEQITYTATVMQICPTNSRKCGFQKNLSPLGLVQIALP